jgi:hypothetical protein
VSVSLPYLACVAARNTSDDLLSILLSLSGIQLLERAADLRVNIVRRAHDQNM